MTDLARVLSGEERWCVVQGDNREVMSAMPDACIDAIVTDPPAGIAFMAQTWDGDKGGRDAWIAWLAAVMREALRVCKPGAHALVWSLPRTSGWTSHALEDAGWEVRDCLYHLFASGFPKSLNISKGIDRRNGDARPVIGIDRASARRNPNPKKSSDTMERNYGVDARAGEDFKITSAASAASAAWDGWGTALKPAVECWWLARKPIKGTVAANVLAHGTGGLHIDACRIGHASAADLEAHAKGVEAIKARGGSMENSWKNSSDLAGASDVTPLGRWPAHLALSHAPECQPVGSRGVDVRPILGAIPGQPVKSVGFTRGSLAQVKRAEVAEVYSCVEGCPVRMLDEQSGDRPGMSGGGVHRDDYPGGMFGGIDSDGTARADRGGASRFFFQAKPSRAEKAFGLEELEAVPVNDGRQTPIDNAYQRGETKRRNVHPTVKSLAFMRWLCKLITPPGGVVFDPFAGSGSTLIAARREGFRAIGVDQWDKAVEIARARVERWEQVRPDMDDAEATRAAAPVDERQRSLFGGGR